MSYSLIRRALASSVTAEVAITVEGRSRGAAASLCPPVVALRGCACMREQFAVAFWRHVCSFCRPLFADGCLFASFEARVTFGARDREGRAFCGDYGVPVEPVVVATAFKSRRLSVVGYLSERRLRCSPWLSSGVWWQLSRLLSRKGLSAHLSWRNR